MTTRRILCGVLVLGLALLLVPGCGAKVSKDKFDKITDGMTLADVEMILGKGELQAGASGGIGNLLGSAKIYKWVDGAKSITVTFVNDKVTAKVCEGL